MPINHRPSSIWSLLITPSILATSKSIEYSSMYNSTNNEEDISRSSVLGTSIQTSASYLPVSDLLQINVTQSNLANVTECSRIGDNFERLANSTKTFSNQCKFAVTLILLENTSNKRNLSVN